MFYLNQFYHLSILSKLQDLQVPVPYMPSLIQHATKRPTRMTHMLEPGTPSIASSVTRINLPINTISESSSNKEAVNLQIQLHPVANAIILQRKLILKRPLSLPLQHNLMRLSANFRRDYCFEEPCRYHPISFYFLSISCEAREGVWGNYM